MRDFTLDQSHGSRTVTERYGYYPETHSLHPGARDAWVILCTVPGALGPFSRVRTITESPWVMDARDPHVRGNKSNRSNCPSDCPCICHELGGGWAHPGRRCADLSTEEKTL